MKHLHAERRRGGWAAALMLAVATGAQAQAAPEPLRQLDFPVLAHGETGQFRVQVPAVDGDAGAAVYSVHAVMPGSAQDGGYRFFAVDCPQGFRQSVHAGDRGVACYLAGGGPHPSFIMTVSVLNLAAADGETRQDDALRSLTQYAGATRAPWFLYGVTP